MGVLKRAVVGLVLLVILLALAVYWLLFTGSGLRAGVEIGRSFLPDTVTFDSLEGELAGQLHMQGVTINTESAVVEFATLTIDWSPNLLRERLLRLDSLQLNDVNIRLLDSSSKDPDEPVALPDAFDLPIDLQVDELIVENLTVAQGDDSYVIDRVDVHAEWVDTTLSLNKLSMQAAFADAELAGRVTTAGNYPLQLSLSGTLKQQFAIPVTGEVTLSAIGALDNLAVEGEVQMVGNSVPAVEVSYSAEVQTNPRDLLAYEFIGRVSLTGNDINTADYAPNLPGRVSIEAVANVGHKSGGEPAIDLTAFSLNGELLAESIRVDGAGDWNGDTGQVNKLRALWGEYRLSVHGQVGETSELDWSAELPDLAQAGKLIEQQWSGAVTGSGQLLGSLDAPRVIAQLEATAVSMQGINVAQASVAADLSTSDKVRLDVLLDEIEASGEVIEQIRLGVKGRADDHQVALTLKSSRAEVLLGADAALADARFTDKTLWSFDVSQLEVIHPDLNTTRADHRWQLAAHAGGELSGAGFTLERLCLNHVLPDSGGGLCIDAQYASEAFASTVEVQKLGLANLNSLLPLDTRVVGELSGMAHWTGEVSTTLANMALDGVGLSLRKNGEWLDVAKFAPGTLRVSPLAGDTGDELALNVSLPLTSDNTQGLFADISTVVGGDATGAVAGTVRAELPDLAWLAAFTEQVDELSGSLVSDVSIAGTLAEPHLFGVTKLDLPSILIRELDLELLNTQLTLTGTPQGLHLAGSSGSGEGMVTLNSEVALQDKVEVTGTLKGEDFLISDSSDARIAVSPDLTATFVDEKLVLRGDVAVPLARVTLDKVPSGAITASKDQRFLEQEVTETPFDTDVRVRLVLGEEVSFEGLGLNATFGGDLAIRDRSNQVTTATGEIEVIEGTYQAYGQDLRIKNGKLVFAGGPIDEPGLDFRALRQATPEIEVGVLVQGSLREPALEVFSTPSLPESDQLAYLVLGRPLSSSSASENSLFQQAAMAVGVQGGQLLTDRLGSSLGVDSIGIESEPGTSNAQAALVVGKYLTPRLYVSYGYGLFEPISTLRLEYQLNRLWRIVTESTNTATGGDILWVYER